MSGNFAIKGGGVGRLMANAILNFHFDFPHPSLRAKMDKNNNKHSSKGTQWHNVYWRKYVFTSDFIKILYWLQ